MFQRQHGRENQPEEPKWNQDDEPRLEPSQTRLSTLKRSHLVSGCELVVKPHISLGRLSPREPADVFTTQLDEAAAQCCALQAVPKGSTDAVDRKWIEIDC